MRLADELTTAATSVTDDDRYSGVADAYASLAKSIADAQCFELSADVTEACINVATSKPSTILSALPYARLPYPKIWVEWVPKFIEGQYRQTPDRPTPSRIGFLLEEVKEFAGRELICATWIWSHKQWGINICPLGAIFDWHADADLSSMFGQLSVLVTRPDFAAVLPDEITKLLNIAQKGLTTTQMTEATEARTKKPGLDDAYYVLSEVPAWRKLVKNEEEARALLNTFNHSELTFSRHCLKMVGLFLELPQDQKSTLMNTFADDLKGEPAFAEAFVIMLNTKNGLNTQKEDLSKLNKARYRAKRSPLREFMITRLSLSRHANRQIGSGVTDRQLARQHLVRGHFKVRRTGIYWWSPFVRGNPLNPVSRDHYQVR